MLANHPFARRSLNVLDENGQEGCAVCGRTRGVHPSDAPTRSALPSADAGRTTAEPEELTVIVHDRRGRRGGLAPVLVHTDGTNCRHEGQPKSMVGLPGGPACPAGKPVDALRFDGTTLTIEQVQRSLKSIGEAWTKLITPGILVLVAAAAPLIDGDPVIRALAAAAAALDQHPARTALPEDVVELLTDLAMGMDVERAQALADGITGGGGADEADLADARLCAAQLLAKYRQERHG